MSPVSISGVIPETALAQATVAPPELTLAASWSENRVITHSIGRSYMSGELETAAKTFIAAIDSLDLERILRSLGQDVQSVDEVSRQWLRGNDEVRSYLAGLVAAVSVVHTELQGAEERVWEDTGLLTCWLEQTYTIDGNPQQISAPTTLVFRREGGEWKLVLFHSIPLPEQS
jgi:ketosteroid isomerase-like protein